MKVILNDSVYEMDLSGYQKFLKIAKRMVPHGIYAVEKNGVCEIKNETFIKDEELKANIKSYESQGFVVHYN